MTERLPRGSLDRSAIEAAARAVIAEAGVEEFSIPRVARELGVRPTAVQWHFKRRDDLLAVLSVSALRDFNALVREGRTGRWQDRLTRYWTDYRDVLRRDTVLLELLVVRWTELARMPEAVQLSYERIDTQLEILMGAGFSPERAARAYHVLSTYCRGSLLNERASIRSGRPAELGERSLRRLGADLSGLPSMRLAAPFWTFTFSTSADYTAGLHTIVAGLESELAQ